MISLKKLFVHDEIMVIDKKEIEFLIDEEKPIKGRILIKDTLFLPFGEYVKYMETFRKDDR